MHDAGNTVAGRRLMKSKDVRASYQRSLIGLDLLRGLAAFEVFIGHVRDHSFVAYADLPSAQQTHVVQALFVATHFGREAVLVFFALSGFLVFGQVIRRLEDRRFDLSDYVIDRTSRIFLPLIPAVLLGALMGAVVLGRHASAAQIALNLICGRWLTKSGSMCSRGDWEPCWLSHGVPSKASLLL